MDKFDFRTVMEQDIVDNMNVRDDLPLCDLYLTTRWKPVVRFLAEAFEVDDATKSGKKWLKDTKVDIIFTLNDERLYELNNLVTHRFYAQM